MIIHLLYFLAGFVVGVVVGIGRALSVLAKRGFL